MNPPRLLFVGVALLGLGALAYVGLTSTAPHDARSAGGAATDPRAVELEQAPAAGSQELSPAVGAAAPSASGQSRRSAADPESTRRAGAPTRALSIELVLPAGAPADPGLAVLAVDGAALDGESSAELLEALRERPGALLARGTVDASGSAQLDLIGGEQPMLVVDGQFLFLAAPVALSAESRRIRLEPKLGARLVVRVDTSAVEDASVLEGEVGLMGGSMSGGNARRGWERRSRGISSDGALEFRALDAGLTWTISPAFDAHYAPARLGLELEPGEERVVDVSPTLGATLAGEVRDESGAAVSGATVRVTAGAMNWMGGGGERSVTSDAEGRFTLRGVAPGEQVVEAELEGWRTTETDIFTVEDGQTRADLRLVLDRGESLSGLVRWDDGSPAEGALVTVEARRRGGWGNWGGSGSQRAGSAESLSDGSFEIGGLDPGKYTLRATAKQLGLARGEAPAWRAALEGVKASGTGLVLDLAGPIAFSGRVVDDRGEPVTAFELEVRSTGTGGPRAQQAFEDADGLFEFTRVGPGEWSVEARAEGHVQRESLDIVLGAEEQVLELLLERRVALAGRVLDAAGVPVAGAVVRADDGTGSGNAWMGARGPRAEADGEGRFRFDELTPGAVSLTAGAEGWADSEAVSFQLAPGDMRDDAELLLRVGGRIQGAVLTPEGDPVVGQRVTWGSNSMGFGSNGDSSTDASGSFEFEHVTPGEWSVSAVPSMQEMGERMRGRRDPSAFTEIMGQLVTETVEVADGETTEVFLGGEPRRPVRVLGTVTLAGEPVTNATVYAVSESSAVFEGMKSAQVGEDGSFELVVDRPGPHTISAQVGGDGAAGVGVAVATVIPEEDEVRVDLPIPLGRIEGVVRRAGGRAAAGVRLSIQREDGLGRMRWGGDQDTTDESGAFAFEALEPGVYTVRANTPGWGGRADTDWGTVVRGAITVGADEEVTGVDFRLERSGSVSGTVADPDGGAVAGASLFFRDVDGRLVSSVSSVTTNAAGEFRATGLAPGEYAVSARAEGFAAGDATGVRVVTEEESEVRVELEPATLLVVSVEDGDGDLFRARVEVVDGDGAEVGALMTMADMRATFNAGRSALEQKLGPLPPGRYTVRATLSDGRQVEKRVSVRGRTEEKKVRLKLED